MVRPRIVTPEVRAFIKLNMSEKVDKLVSKTRVSRAHIYRIWKEPSKAANRGKKNMNVGGRPSKLSVREKRRLIRLVSSVRREDPNWTINRLMTRADVTHVSRRTVTRFLNENGYKYLQARKKGLLTKKDRRMRMQFAKKMLNEYPENVWTTKIAFYLDCAGFVYKRNPCDQALAPTGRVWRKHSEGLAPGCTAKGRACGTGGKYVKVVVAISYGKGVICCIPYDKMDGKYFANFLHEHFDMMVESAEKDSRLWLQDGDPSQNSALAKEVMKQVNSELLSIPARSPDINPIENLFAVAKAALRREAIERNITAETTNEFEARVKRTLREIPVSTTDRIIESMNHRMRIIIKQKGARLKY